MKQIDVAELARMVRGLQIPRTWNSGDPFLEIVARRDLPTPFKAVWSVALFSKAGQARVVVALRLGSPVGIGDTSPPYWLCSIVGIAVLLAVIGEWSSWRESDSGT